MSTRLESSGGMPDIIKWVVAIGILAAGIVAYYVYAEQSQLLRVIGVLVAAGVALAIAYQTDKGKEVWGFLKEARTELRKVVWPSRKETLSTTGLIIVVVAIVGVLLWMLDGVLVRIIKAILGTG
ncbi:MAG: preprotein translocase subunit SecE [Gammaproteobacteria bacterium]|nr:preprotein translocase subunit SecE [Gammaproteobacteria bacterium]